MIVLSRYFPHHLPGNSPFTLEYAVFRTCHLLLTCAWSALPLLAFAAEQNPMESCLLEQLRQPGSDSLLVAELRRRCLEQLTTNVDASRDQAGLSQAQAEEPARGQPRFSRLFEPYKESYLLAGSMKNQDGGEPFSGKTADIKFKLGLKFRVFPERPAFENLAPLYVGYAQESWWDVAESSGPFREHNYTPEVFWDYSRTSNRNGLNFIGRFIDQVGYEHQSNGEDGLESRSWDRLYAQRRFRLGERLEMGVKAWNVISREPFNEDITDYLGNVRLDASFRANDRLTVNVRTLKGWETSKVSYQLDLVYQVPEWVNSQFMLSYYEGYGEALISYNRKTSSLRAGLSFPISFDGQ